MLGLIILIIFSFASFVPLANAYIDPGTGGLIIRQTSSVVTGILAAIIGVLGAFFWKPLKKASLKIWGLISFKK